MTTGSIKSMSLFDHLNNLFTKKNKWKDLSEGDKKSFSTYMVNRFLSMDINLIDTVNSIQEYTYNLSNELVYNIYLDILPYRKNAFIKYIKGDKSKKYNPELLKLLADHLQLSRSEVEEFLELNFNITKWLQRFGFNDKEIKKLIKVDNDE